MSSAAIVTAAVEFINTALPAGFIPTADKSPPKAPKAPLKALKRAVPEDLSKEYLRASVMSCALIIVTANIAMSKTVILFIGFL